MPNGGYVYVSSDAAWHPLYPSGPTTVWDVYNVDSVNYDSSSILNYTTIYDQYDYHPYQIGKMPYLDPIYLNDGTVLDIDNWYLYPDYIQYETSSDMYNSYQEGAITPGYILRLNQFSYGDVDAGNYQEGTYWELLGYFHSMSIKTGTSYHVINYYAYSSTPTNVKGSWIQAVESTNSSAYPDNGIHTDGKWYVKQT